MNTFDYLFIISVAIMIGASLETSSNYNDERGRRIAMRTGMYGSLILLVIRLIQDNWSLFS